MKQLIFSILALAFAMSANAANPAQKSETSQTQISGEAPKWVIPLMDEEVKAIWVRIEAGEKKGRYRKTFTNSETGETSTVNFSWQEMDDKLGSYMIVIDREKN